MESAAEAEELAERRQGRARKAAEQGGEALLDLAIQDHRSGLGGRHLLTFVKRNRTLPLPSNRLRVGSPVVVTSLDDPEQKPQSGVVSARKVDSIQVAVDHWIAGSRFDLDLSADEVSRNRERAALQNVSVARGRLGELRQIALGDLDPGYARRRQPRFGKVRPLTDAAGLNASQRAAIEFALAAEDLAIIHGPPGTGKTTSVAAFICQAAQRGEKVLACAPSNTAVDNLLERLIDAGQRVVRIGHPARVKEALRSHALDALVEAHDNMQVVKELLRDAEQLYRKADRYTRAKPARGQKQDWRREARQLKAEARHFERRAINDVLDGADVICATTSIDDVVLGDRTFDWVVIDEACQCTESASWVPLQRGQRILLAGDHCQLPPTVVSTAAAREGYARSMLERLVETFGADVTRQLEVQYRMHAAIMRFSSGQFYGDSLEADAAVHGHLLSDLPHVASCPLTDEPLEFVDTAGANYDEAEEPDGASRLNPAEGRLVLAKVARLLEAGLPAADIAVIAPYAAQVRWLRQHAPDRQLEIDTVDGFQGREKEAVVISLVRSNRTGEIGFLQDTRRMNVALTRARRKLIVVGDSATLGGHPFYADLLAYFESTNSYHTVWEEMD
ncbi:MAG: AAA family ATPase [Planctomycetota bacterium]|nr:MAG: AAA family ATPase [Planctomycetota bacterium]